MTSLKQESELNVYFVIGAVLMSTTPDIQIYNPSNLEDTCLNTKFRCEVEEITSQAVTRGVPTFELKLCFRYILKGKKKVILLPCTSETCMVTGCLL